MALVPNQNQNSRGDAVVATGPDASGNFTLRGMRIFHALGKGSNGEHEFNVNREWCEAAVAKSRARFDLDGYRSPATIFHRSSGKQIPAGTFVAQEVRVVEYEGKPTPTVFADVVVSGEVYRDIKAGRLPFRSVEILDYEAQEFSALAFLPDREPFCKYGLLGISETIAAGEASELTIANFSAPQPCLTFAQNGKRSLGLFKFEQEVEEKKPDEKPPAKAGPGGEEGKPDVEAEKDDDPKGKPGIANEDGEGEKANGSGDLAGLIRNLIDMIRGVLTLKNVFQGSDQGDAPQNNPKPPVEMEAKPKKEEEPPMPDTTPKTVTIPAAEFEALKTRLGNLETGNASTVAESAAAKRLDAARIALTGFNLSTADLEDLKEFSKGEQPMLDRIVATIKRRGKGDGPRTAEEAFGSDGDDSDPKEVAEFAAQGPDKLEKARKLARHHALAAKRGLRSNLKDYLAANMDDERVRTIGRRESEN